ncbi:hypothetical protein RHD99_08170 [Buttiauxella selenatireducens]|uniref:Flippase-like domain-containing protein n=1 Tax=Buttiauxella selenatireducens TaxID=3073902 RepID=A0ABY9SEH7_9ENTR|nr:hypothetical protein [Buttiauxella sp. R73]WMY75902.1 hypothetical protein RHD99_08170 [Buttiauxella sp. R73]
MKKINLRKWLNYLGSIIALLSIVFVAHRITKYWAQIPDGTFTLKLFLIIILLAGAYGAANFILAAAWKILMVGLHQHISHRVATRIYGMTQLAKYVPGNIFQFAGRQLLTMSYGFSGKAIAKSTFLELLLLIITGAIYIFWMLPLLYPGFSVVYGLSLFIVTIVGLVLGLEWQGKGNLIKVVIKYLLFLFISGGVFLCVLYSIVDNWVVTPVLIFPLIGAYVISWLVGLVTPGSPAGVGVREFLLILFLKPLFTEVDIIMAVVLGRVVTIIGDCFFYLYSFSLRQDDYYE